MRNQALSCSCRDDTDIYLVHRHSGKSLFIMELDDLNQILIEHNLNFDIKEEQLECLQHLEKEENVFAQLPTGYGRSLILLEYKFNFDSKDEQLECLQHIEKGENVFAQLPTGYGKSLILLEYNFNFDIKEEQL